MDGERREVRFDIYCKHCKHKNESDHALPCSDCLAEPTNQYSEIPIKFEGSKLPCHSCEHKHGKLSEEPCRHCEKLRKYLA